MINGNQKQNLIDLDYTTSSIEVLFKKFHTSQNGLSYEDAQKRLEEYGYNSPAKKKKRTALVQVYQPLSYRSINHRGFFSIFPRTN
jgi:magnesium-transporting ATPase (P-type)